MLEHNGCCDSHSAIWNGHLGSADKVELRLTEGGGGSAASVTFSRCAEGPVLYVNAANAAGSDGSSWAAAFSNLQDALLTARIVSSVSEIWVAQGTYKPDQGLGKTAGDRTAAFSMKNNLAIYGGFAGVETSRSQRNWMSNPTILSCDFNGDDVIYGSGASLQIYNNGENAYRVVDNTFAEANPLLPSAILDGFTITGGSSEINLIGGYNRGAGMLNLNASPSLKNLVFRGNRAEMGGGGLMNSLNCSPTLTNVIFDRNYSQNDGGAIYNFKGANTVLTNVSFLNNRCYGLFGGGAVFNGNNSPVFINCRFDGNQGTAGGAAMLIGATASFTNCSFSNNGADQDGAGLWVETSQASFKNCVWSGNRAGFYGGALTNRGSNVEIINSTLFDNRAGVFDNSTAYTLTSVFAIDGTNPVTTVENSIIWGNLALFNNTNPTITNSIVQGGWPGTGNSSSNPFFMNSAKPAGADGIFGTADDGLSLLSCSPALNTGDNNVNATQTDLADNPRIYNRGQIDLGAYEYAGDATAHVVYFVNANAASGGDGLSWQTAFRNFQDALTATRVTGCATEVWVAKGTYRPDRRTAYTQGDRSALFAMINGISIYGGFAGGETDRSQRNWRTNTTILSGDIGAAGDNGDNSYHVINNTGLDNTAVIDGFTITGGNTNGDTNNSGGGMSNTNSSLTINNCIFSANGAIGGGGGLSNYASSPVITSCSFLNNSAANGGGVYNLTSAPLITNCVFYANAATTSAGGMYNGSSTPRVVNCTFSANSAAPGQAGAMLNTQATPVIVNCILWGNGDREMINIGVENVSYSLIKGRSGGTGGLDGTLAANDPVFVNAATGNLRLLGCSPAVNAGLNSANTIQADLDGNQRVFNNGVIDLGAYENQGTTVSFTYYRDSDGDGFGDPTKTTTGCSSNPPSGYVADNTDCNDADAAINPATKWYLDTDGDGYYTGNAVTQCTSPGTGYKYTGLNGGGDCADGDNTIYPGAPEICGDGKDNNCNGTTDEGCSVITVASYALVNATTKKDVKALSNAAVIDLGTIPGKAINIRANTSPTKVGSVLLNLTGAELHDQTQNAVPYALFSDVNGNYLKWYPTLGSYTLKATPYSSTDGKGTVGTPLTITFKVVDNSANTLPTADAGPDKTVTLPTSQVALQGSGADADGYIKTYSWTQQSGPNTASFSSKTIPQPTVSGLIAGTYVFALIVTDNRGSVSTADYVTVVVKPALSGLTLVNAQTDKDIATLVNNAVIDLAQTPAITIRANTATGTKAGSVRFAVNSNSNYSIDNAAQFALAGDNGSGDYFAWNVTPGSYTIKATPYSGSNGSGVAGATISVNFTVKKSTAAPTKAAMDVNAGAIDVGSGLYPNPTTGPFTVRLTNARAETAQVLILDGKGTAVEQRVVTLTQGAQNLSFNLEGKAAGLYFVQLKTASSVQTFKVFLNH